MLALGRETQSIIEEKESLPLLLACFRNDTDATTLEARDGEEDEWPITVTVVAMEYDTEERWFDACLEMRKSLNSHSHPRG